MTKKYIEFRVYLKDSINTQEITEIAQQLQDKIADFVSYDDAPPVFTQDVTYEVKDK